MRKRKLPIITVALPAQMWHALKKAGMPRVDAAIYHFSQLPETTPDALIVCQTFFQEDAEPHFARVKVIMKSMVERGGLLVSWGSSAETTQDIDDERTEAAYSRGALDSGYEEALRILAPALPISMPIDLVEPACSLSANQLKAAPGMRQLASRGIVARFSIPWAGKKVPFPVESLIADKDSGQTYAAQIKYGEADIIVLPCPKLSPAEIIRLLVGYAKNHGQPLPDQALPDKAILTLSDSEAVFMGCKLELRPTPLKVLYYFSKRAGKSLANKEVVRACLRKGSPDAALRNHIKDINDAVRKAAKKVSPSARSSAVKLASNFITVPASARSRYRLGLSPDQISMLPGEVL